MHTEETLRRVVARKLRGRRFIAVSNREPFIHVRQGERIACLKPASGLTTALDPILRATGGVWIAHGSGDADRDVAGENGRVMVPPENPSYALKRVWLTARQEYGYYYGFANQALWPLCHVAYQFPLFDELHWETYREVNRQFAEAVAEELAGQPAFVFIQDYHLALLAGMIKELCPNVITAQFWHIPWPNAEVFRICPWKEEILEGLLKNDMLGFHLRYDCLNFVDAVSRFLEARVDSERLTVSYQGARAKVRAFPISVDFEAIQQQARAPEVEAEMAHLRTRYSLTTEFLAVGVDRLDYTKGIPERFRAIDRFLDKYPSYRGRVTFFQAGVPTRMQLPLYQNAEREMRSLADQINRKHRNGEWRPIVFVEEHFSPAALNALYRLANACIVSSLHDGMNLVAKEFVSARSDEDGVLILSRFTGSARELTPALLINPYAIDDFAETIQAALTMAAPERRTRMRRLRRIVAANNIYGWATSIVEKISDLSEEVTDHAAPAMALAGPPTRTGAGAASARPLGF